MAKTSKIALPPRKDNNPEEVQKPVSKVSERKIEEVIKKGGSTTRTTSVEEDRMKNININILESELRMIRSLREMRPKPRGKRLAISAHDWIIEAIQEKIQRERKTYKV